MGKYTDAYNNLLRKKPVQPRAPLAQPTSLSRRFESLGVQPSLVPRVEKPIVPVTKPVVPTTLTLEEQRLQRDIRTTGRTVPEITASGRDILARQQVAPTQQRLADIGRPTAIAPIKTVEELLPQTGKQAAFQTGVAKAFLPTTSFDRPQEGFLGQALEQKIQQQPEGVKPFEIGGRLVGTALQYATVSKAIAPLIKTAGLSGVKAFAVKQGADLLVDNIVQLPGEVIDSIKNDLTMTEDAKRIALRNVIDIGFNAAIGIPEMVKLYKSAKATGIADEALQTAVDSLPDATRKTIQQELGIEEGVTAQQFLKEQEQVAKEIEVEQYYKQFEPDIPKVEPIVEPIAPQVPQPKTFAEQFRVDEGLTPLKPEPLKVSAADVEVPRVELPSARVDVPQVGKAIQESAIKSTEDAKSIIMTEMPTKPKGTLYDAYESAQQAITSLNVPVEKMGGRAKVLKSNLNRVAGEIESSLVNRQAGMDGSNIGKSLSEIFETTKKEDKQTLYELAFHRHNVDRFREEKGIFGKTFDSEMSLKRVQEIESEFPHLKEVNNDITKYMNNLLHEWGVKSGLTSKDTARMLDEMYANYVPTYRAKDFPKSMSQGNQNIAQILKKAKGSESQILPLDQQMVLMTDRIIKNARKNESMLEIAKRFDEEGPGRYVKEIRGGKADATITDLLDVGKNLEVEPISKGNDFVVNFYKDGKQMEMVVNKNMYRALTTVQSENFISKFGNIVKKYWTQPVKDVITTYNPVFGISNPIRDSGTALAFSSDPIKFVANLPDAAKEIFTNGEMYQLFKSMGGTREGLIASGKTFKVPSLAEQNAIIKAVKKGDPIKMISAGNNFTETLPRFSEFMTVYQKTGDPALAVYKAAELTTDFSRYGGLSKEIDKFVPYFNASVQGMSTFARKVKENPLKVAAQAGTVITVPTMILDQINKDDEDYNNLSPRERNLYYNIPYKDKEGNKQFIRLGKTRELGVIFSSLFEWSARASRGQKVTGEEIWQAFKENFSPADPFTHIATPLLKGLKQIADPNSYQTNYFDSLIVPQSQRQYSPGEQYDLNSSGIAKAIGKQFNISPFVIDYLLKSYTGIVGQVIQPIGAERQTNILLDPFKKKFTTDPVFRSDATNQFYDLLSDTRTEHSDYKKEHDIPSGKKTPFSSDLTYLNKQAKTISTLRKELKEFQKKKDKEKQIRELQKRINEISADTVKRVER